ncbi:CRISPR-associated endonuclease Cas6 [Arcicella lustrica]|uniref:CRISPR-associated endonuclease Cas6 n=1 Tax=Arcicella lustrica TaxID=2984196 RepID=A0ABU5SNQ9_9BACT|nr:CRISPR-associated endonuclease Cas6 [Arcicella sp. DC25W]MEA5428907.1 CRISPR-associated endonuclease Cas6 [Arcicella sp. DC25W]
MQTIHQTIIRFPEIQLATRDAHKLRGYFGNIFQEYSPLLHNHLESGESAYRYPLVQYKVINRIPTLVGLNEGADLLINLFLKIKTLQIEDKTYQINQKNIESKTLEIGLSNELHSYRFQTLWMALNQENHQKYLRNTTAEQQKQLNILLQNNILSYFKAMNYWVNGQVMGMLQNVYEKETKFKDKSMIAFQADFVSNAVLPSFIGIGKSVARGFGTLEAI